MVSQAARKVPSRRIHPAVASLRYPPRKLSKRKRTATSDEPKYLDYKPPCKDCTRTSPCNPCVYQHNVVDAYNAKVEAEDEEKEHQARTKRRHLFTIYEAPTLKRRTMTKFDIEVTHVNITSAEVKLGKDKKLGRFRCGKPSPLRKVWTMLDDAFKGRDVEGESEEDEEVPTAPIIAKGESMDAVICGPKHAGLYFS